jgi:hypothetical protein
MLKPSKSRLESKKLARLRDGGGGSRETTRREVIAEKARAATGGGKPSKAKAQGRYRHETRPERLRVE